MNPSTARVRTLTAKQAPPADILALESALQEAAGVIGPSVVSITSKRRVEQALPAFMRDPGDDGLARGVGSGVIVDGRGYILTNNHVVEGATALVVRLDDDRELDAVVIGRDPKTDLAVIEIEAEGLQAASLADSNGVRVGQWVMAAGSPFGLPRTVTAGIVSAVGRGAMGITDYGDFIQTDAAVNQGNSGGPLIDLEGRVVGINTAIASRNGGSNGIGFAIPINLARNVMEQLIEDGRVRRGWIGVVMGELDAPLAESFGFEGTQGILINDVDPDGPARLAGLEPGDIITELDGVVMGDMGDLRNTISQRRPGTDVTLGLWRAGAATSISLTLGTLPGDDLPRAAPEPKPNARALELGLRLEAVPKSVQGRYGLRQDEGALVSDVVAGSLAAEAGLRPADVIIEVADVVVASVGVARRSLARADFEAGVRLRVKRGPWSRYVVVKRQRD